MNLHRLREAIAVRPGEPPGFADLFARTWQCSHVRYCRALFEEADYSREDALAWILTRNEAAYDPGWVKSVVICSVLPATISEISAVIARSIAEIEASDFLPNPGALPLKLLDVSNATSPLRIEGLDLNRPGGNEIYLWERLGEFNYLEIHWES